MSAADPGCGVLLGARLRGNTLLALAREHGPALARRLRASGYEFVVATDEDAPVRGDALDVKATSVLAAALPALRGFGVLPSVDLTLAEPFNVAREAATIDILSDGRAGLALLSPVDGLDAAAYGVPYRDLDDPAGLMREAIEVLRLLWDSWAPDAVARDWATNRFVDADRVRRIDYEGEVLRIAGPSATPRSPQGVLPIVADLAGCASPGEALRGWAAGADVVAVDEAALREVADGLRGPGAPRVFVSIAPGEPASSQLAAERTGLDVAGVLVDATGVGDDEALVELERSGLPGATRQGHRGPIERVATADPTDDVSAPSLRTLFGLAPAESAWELVKEATS